MSLPAGGIGSPYSAGITASGDYTFSGGGGGLTVSANGSLSGTPTQAGIFQVSVTVTDSEQNSASTTLVLTVDIPTLVVTGGDWQIVKVGDAPAPMTISLKVGGAGLAGVPVSLGSQSMITDESVSATFLLPETTSEGSQNYSVSFPGGGATVSTYAYAPPAAASGTSPETLPGPPATPPVTPVEDGDVIVESRWISTSSGTLEAFYSPGLAIRYVGGMFQTSQAEWGGAPDYSRQGTSWMTSDGQTGTGTPPSLEALPWAPGLAGGYDAKYPDTDYGPVAWPEEVTTGVQLPSWIYDPGTVLVWGGGYFGKSKGRQKHITSQVRIRRKTTAEGGSGSNEAVTKAFVDVTNKTDANDVETVVNCTVQNLTLSQDQSQSPPTTLSTSAQVGEANERKLLPIDIEPDVNMAGVVGNVVKSAKADSTVEHFVTPRKSTELNQNYVELVAVGVDTAIFSQLFEWEGGEAGITSDKRKVKRDGAGKTEVKIKTKQGGTVASQMNVWVVWTDIALVQGVAATLNRGNVTTPNPPGLTGLGSSIATLWGFNATIEPQSIINDPEHPDFSGSPKSDAPNRNALNANDGKPFGQPVGKWDISRQIRCRILSPQIGTKDMIAIPGTLNNNLPNANIIQPTTPAPGTDSFPQNKLEGNDDSAGNDPGNESTDPYTGPNKGALVDFDTPTFPVVIDKSPQLGSEIDFRVHFREFCRLEIGGKWFLISDLKPWRLHGKLKKTWIVAEDDADGNGVPSGTEGQMRDNGSVSDDTNNGW